MTNFKFDFDFKSVRIAIISIVIHCSMIAQKRLPKTGASAQEIADKLANPVVTLISVLLLDLILFFPQKVKAVFKDISLV